MAQRRNVDKTRPYSVDKGRDEMRQAIIRLRRLVQQGLASLAETLEPVLKPLFAINQASAMIRTLIFAAGFLLWVLFAYLVNPPAFGEIDLSGGAGGESVSGMLAYLRFLLAAMVALVVPLFAPEVFRFVLAITFAFWLASRIAAIYLADIFNLPNISVAIRFIRQAAFATFDPRRMNRLAIRESQVPQNFQNSPLYQIGGPGLVLVNLENVAVFEKVDGTPDIIPPTGYPVLIEGFERLRKIIDLRDQFIENQEVSGRTKDGIPVSAKGIRFSFSIQRDQIMLERDEIWSDPSLPQPLSYTRESVLHHVYEKPNEAFDVVGIEEVRSAIRSFIGRNSLSQFLADSRDESEVPKSLPSDPTMPITTGEDGFKARETINQELIASFKNTISSTIDLHWVSVGTWVPPAEIPEKHKEAVKLRAKSEAESNPKALTKLLRTTLLKEILRLIQDVPINAFGHVASRETDPHAIKRELMLAYREKIKIAHEIYLANELEPPAHLVAALNHLQRL